jgi:hypothetical protein
VSLKTLPCKFLRPHEVILSGIVRNQNAQNRIYRLAFLKAQFGSAEIGFNRARERGHPKRSVDETVAEAHFRIVLVSRFKHRIA